MGGRGAKSGLSTSVGAGGSSLYKLIQDAKSKADFDANTDPNKMGDYDGGGNPNLIQYQSKEDDKTANFLASTARLDLNDPQYADGYAYHDIPLNRLLLRLGLNGTPTVLDEAQFNKYVQQTGAPVVYRGWSGSAAVDRFVSATHNHIGNGIFGDGYYFSPDINVAASYTGSGSLGNGEITKMALSPTARIIDIQAVRAAYNKLSPKLQRALSKSGKGGSGRTYGSNDGEMQLALKMGYNVIQSGDYLVAATGDAFIVSKKRL